ncbi:hypothetical protein OROMI_001455 [Orobanche minor]
MASSPNVRRSPNSATGADAESAADADAAAASAAATATTEAENQISCLKEMYEYALVTGLRFGDSDFDVHGDDVPLEGSVYDRYPLLSRGGQMLDRIRDRFAGGYFREQSGDALKVAKVLCVCYLIFGVDGVKRIADMWLWTLVDDQKSFPWVLYSYPILVTYLSNVPTEVPAGLDTGYHFYGNIYAIMVLYPTPREEQEPYMKSISDASSERVRYTHPCKRGGRGKGRARDGDASVGDLAGERIIQQWTSGPVISAPLYLTTGRESSSDPHDPVHTDYQCQSSPIRGPRQTAYSPARGTQETASIIDFDTLFTHLHTCIQSAVQEMRQYVDAVVEKSVKYLFRKRKDLDEEAYNRWLDSGESVNVGAACGASASWFLMLQDASTLIDAEHLDAYMGILQFDPGFIGVRWLDDWAAQTVLVHTSFLATCINIWNNSKRKGGPLSFDDEDLDFLISHIHGLRPFWGDHCPWWELREVLTMWNTSPESSFGHWLVLRIRLEEGIIIMHDSLAQEEDAYLNVLDFTSVVLISPHFRVAIAKKDLCYVEDDSTSCGALSIRTSESLVQHSFSHGKTETNIYAFRGRIARAIWRFSDDADTIVCDPTSLFIQFDDRD